MRQRLILLTFLLCTVFAYAQQPTRTPVASVPSGQETLPPPQPLPDVRALMLEVEQNLRNAEAANREYTYHLHQETNEFDKQGHVKKTEVVDSESLTVQGVRVNRVVMRDGKPLTPEEEAKENERIDKIVQHAKEQKAKLLAKGVQTDSRGNGILTVSRILELGTLTNIRVAEFDGRPAWAIDYEGDPNAKIHEEAEAVFRDLVGLIYVDQQDRMLVAAQGHFLKDFKIGLGMVLDVHKDLSFEYRTTKVGDVWLPAVIDGRGKFTYLLFGGMNGHLHMTASNYKKFRTSSTLIPTNHEVDENGNPVQDAPGTPKP